MSHNFKNSVVFIIEQPLKKGVGYRNVKIKWLVDKNVRKGHLISFNCGTPRLILSSCSIPGFMYMYPVIVIKIYYLCYFMKIF